MRLVDRQAIEGFANRAKYPWIRIADGIEQALVWLAVDMEEARLATIVGLQAIAESWASQC